MNLGIEFWRFRRASLKSDTPPTSRTFQMTQYRISVKKHVYKETYNPWSGALHGCEVDYGQLNTLQKWCKENVAQDNWNYYGMHQITPFEFKFRNGEDMLAFKFKFEFL